MPARIWLHRRCARRVRSLAGGVLTVIFAVEPCRIYLGGAGQLCATAVGAGAGAEHSAAAQSPLPIYRNTHYSFAERAADLVSRMTLAERVAQLHTNSAPAIPRLGVQQYTYWSEGQHGVNTLGADTNNGDAAGGIHATSFPSNFASTMTWDPSLTYQETTAISDEARGFLDKSLWGPGRTTSALRPATTAR